MSEFFEGWLDGIEGRLRRIIGLPPVDWFKAGKKFARSYFIVDMYPPERIVRWLDMNRKASKVGKGDEFTRGIVAVIRSHKMSRAS